MLFLPEVVTVVNSLCQKQPGVKVFAPTKKLMLSTQNSSNARPGMVQLLVSDGGFLAGTPRHPGTRPVGDCFRRDLTISAVSG
jgi:hypothetical protein